MSRTENTIKRRTVAIKGMDDLSHRGFEKFRRETPIITRDFMVRSAIRIYVDTLKNISDLEVIILRNQTARGFVTSDDPAVLTNRLYAQRLGDTSFGLVSAGVQLTLPLTPNLALICYDRDAYSVPNRSGKWVDLKRERDVVALNELQYLSCSANIYFRDWGELQAIRGEFSAAASRRPEAWFRWWVGVQEREDARGEFYRRATEAEISSQSTKIVSHSAIYPVPSRWLGEFTYRPKVFAYANGSSVRFVRKGQVARFSGRQKFIREEVKFKSPPDPLGPKTAYMDKAGIEEG